MRRILWIVLILLVGCGGPTALTSQSSDGTVAARSDAVHASVGPVTVALNAGWNAVGFQAASLTSLNANSDVAGMATYDNGYQVGPLTMAGVNAGAGTRRGFWLYAASPTSLTYSGTDSTSISLDLKSGWNLVAFPTSANIPGSQLTCRRNGQPASLASSVLSTFYELGAGSNVPVDVNAGGVCKPGKAYWVYALEAVNLSYGSTGPTPSPTSIYANGNLGAVSPGGTPPTFTLTSAHVITQMWTYHYLFSGTLGTLSLKDASGTTYGPWTASGLTSSTQPQWYWTVMPNLTVPAGTYTVYDSDPASWSQNAGSGGKGHVQVYGYPVGTTPSPTPTPSPATSPSPAGGGVFTLTNVTVVLQGEPSGHSGQSFWDYTYSEGNFAGRQWWVTDTGTIGGSRTYEATCSAPPHQIRVGQTWPISATAKLVARSGIDLYFGAGVSVTGSDSAGQGGLIFPTGAAVVNPADPAGTTRTAVADRKVTFDGTPYDFDLDITSGSGSGFRVSYIYHYKWNP